MPITGKQVPMLVVRDEPDMCAQHSLRVPVRHPGADQVIGDLPAGVAREVGDAGAPLQLPVLGDDVHQRRCRGAGDAGGGLAAMAAGEVGKMGRQEVEGSQGGMVEGA